MATIVFAPWMPTTWCIMPEMPAATYSFGDTNTPLAPII